MNKAFSYIILAALEAETQGLEAFAPIIYTGIGKINASIIAYEAILKYRPDLVINFGTAGSLGAFTGLQRIKNFVQSDMDARALNFERGVTPFETCYLPNNDDITLGTSDSFITEPNKQLEGLKIKIDLVDMEAFALKKVCDHLKVDFHCYKYISDKANEVANVQWQEKIHSGTEDFRELLKKEYGESQLNFPDDFTL